MLQSPFAFYRGTAALMAADLATTPSSGLHVVACGDAHISNFGFYASPERQLLFDLNDFDEGGIAPWEWDLKRLVTSVYIAAIDNGESPKKALAAARTTSQAYRTMTARLHEMSALERFYAVVDATLLESLVTGKSLKTLRKTTAKARKRTSSQVLEKFTIVDAAGERRMADQPPLTQHLPHATDEQMERLWGEYAATTRQEVRFLLRRFRVVDFVLRVVGVGSVGTRSYIVYLEADDGTPLFLQAKEAQPSVLATFGKVPQELAGYTSAAADGEGHRVVSAQRVLQAHSDPFLGWLRGYAGEQGDQVPTDFYWRQFRDMKGSIDLSLLGVKELTNTARVSAALLARAHAQSPGAGRIAERYADAEDLDDVLATFAQGYARICQADFDALAAAADAGRVPVAYGV